MWSYTSIRLHFRAKRLNSVHTRSDIKKYIKLHFPNKYWSIFISMPSTSSWDTFRTIDIFIHHRYHYIYLWSILLSVFLFAHPLIISPAAKETLHATLASTIPSYDLLSRPCQDIRSKQIPVAAPAQRDPRRETMLQMQTHIETPLQSRSKHTHARAHTLSDLNIHLCCEVTTCVRVYTCALLRGHTLK